MIIQARADCGHMANAALCPSGLILNARWCPQCEVEARKTGICEDCGEEEYLRLMTDHVLFGKLCSSCGDRVTNACQRYVALAEGKAAKQ